MKKKERLDKLLVEKKLVDSREKAKRFIMANQVIVDGKKVNKAGTECDMTSDIIIEQSENQYVSRGGIKLEKALNEFNITGKIRDAIAVDIGASTGGFTDCLLKHGVKNIYCIDVGYGQLDWKLRNDERIVNMEKINIRYLDEKQFGFKFDLATIDVSFISLEKVFPVVKEILKENGLVIALIKPQFEAGREHVKKGGIVSDPIVHQETIIRLVNNIKNDFKFVNITFSPIKNTPGNIEYLIYTIKDKAGNDFINIDLIKDKVAEAHKFFKIKL